MKLTSTPQLQGHPLLEKLLALKLVIWCLCLLGVLAAEHGWQASLRYSAMNGILAVGFFLMFGWWLRLRSLLPVGHLEIAALLFTDMAQIAYLIYLSGGSSNPFTSSLLVPIAVAAALLPKWLSACVTLVALLLYGTWVWQGGDLSPVGGGAFAHAEHHQHSTFSLHILGMWLNFLASAILLWIFIAAIADLLQKREDALRQTREKLLQKEQFIAVASLTANTAHALGTPLNSMGLLLEEVEQGADLSPGDLVLLKQQLARCKLYLMQLKNASTGQPSTAVQYVTISQLRENLAQHYQLLSPGAALLIQDLPRYMGDLRVSGDHSLQLALINLIDNALQAADVGVEVLFRALSQEILLEIRDDGPGIDVSVAENFGKPFISSKPGGLGLGIYLSHATLERLGGRVVLTSNTPQGTITQVYLPGLLSHD